MKKILFLLIAVFLLAGTVFADKVRLKNGSVIKGSITLVDSSKNLVQIETGKTGSIALKLEDVEELEFDREKTGIEGWYVAIGGGVPFLDYGRDLKSADETKFPTGSMSAHVYKTLGSNVLLGGGFYSMFLPVKGQQITGSADEKTDDTFLHYSGFEIICKLFLDKVTSGPYLNAAAGFNAIMILKGDLFDSRRQYRTASSMHDYMDDNLMMSRMGISGKIGLGYAFEVNPDEAAILVGADFMGIMNKYDDKRWLSYGANAYVNFMW